MAKLVSFNVKGLNLNAKRRMLLSELKVLKADIEEARWIFRLDSSSPNGLNEGFSYSTFL